MLGTPREARPTAIRPERTTPVPLRGCGPLHPARRAGGPLEVHRCCFSDSALFGTLRVASSRDPVTDGRKKRVQLSISRHPSWRVPGVSHDGAGVGAASAPPREAPVARVREAARPRGHLVLAPGRPARPRHSDQVHALGGVRGEAQARALLYALGGGRVRDHGRSHTRVRRAPVGRRGLRDAGHQRGRCGGAQPAGRARRRTLRREPRVRRAPHAASAGTDFAARAGFPGDAETVRDALR